jgi:hypothetical protein
MSGRSACPASFTVDDALAVREMEDSSERLCSVGMLPETCVEQDTSSLLSLMREVVQVWVSSRSKS